MEKRLPLAFLLEDDSDSPYSRRHRIPHKTFRAATVSDRAFFDYLDSNDTRLPKHDELDGRACATTEYDSYTGEEIWTRRHGSDHSNGNNNDCMSRQSSNGSSSSSCARDEGDDDVTYENKPSCQSRHASLRFDDVVTWVRDVLDESWAHDGVVLCGRCVVADDCSWVVPSRSPTLHTVREVFLAMRNSVKFLDDIHAQHQSAMAECGGGGGGAAAAAVRDVNNSVSIGIIDMPLHACQFSLCKALAGTAAKEMRLFVPYQIILADTSQRSASEEHGKLRCDTRVGASVKDEICVSHATQSAANTALARTSSMAAVPQYAYAGIAQRFTDVCLPSLMSWTAEEHACNFAVMLNRVRKANLLSMACAQERSFLTHLVAALRRWWSTSPDGRARYVRERVRARWANGHANRDDSICNDTVSDDDTSNSSHNFVRTDSGSGKVTEEHAVPKELPLSWMTCLLAVDVMFENASLPVHVLSAKIRLVVRGGEQELGSSVLPLIWEGNDTTASAPCPDHEERSTHELRGTTTTSSCSSNTSPATLHGGGAAVGDEAGETAENVMDDDEDDLSHQNCTSYGPTGVEFLRLFRDADNWNRYVQLLHARMSSDDHHNNSNSAGVLHPDQSANADGTPIDVNGIHASDDREARQKPYCVVASDSSDLISSKDVMAKRSLPLEFVQPELLYANPDAQVFMQRLREAMEMERGATSRA